METADIPQLEKQYPDEWLLFEVYEVDKLNRPTKGKLLAHSPSWEPGTPAKSSDLAGY